MRRRSFVRVQDVVLAPRGGDLVVAGVDASGGALVRRFGLGFLSRRLPRRERRLRALGRRQPHLAAASRAQLRGGVRRAHASCTRPTSPTSSRQVGPRERAAVLAALNTGARRRHAAGDGGRAAHRGARRRCRRPRRRGAGRDRARRGRRHARPAAATTLAQELLARLPAEREERPARARQPPASTQPARS